MTCEDKEKERIEEMEIEEEEKKRLLREVKLHKYIGACMNAAWSTSETLQN